MKITKRIVGSAIALTMIIGIPQYVSANVVTTSNQEVFQMPKFSSSWGSVKEKGDKQIHITNSSNINNDVILNISDETKIIDAVSGLPVSLDDIDVNESVYAYTSPIMTMSLPPMTSAKAIIVNIPQDFKVPNYMEVQDIKENDDGSITVTSDDGLLQATLNKDTNISPYLTRNIVTIDDVKVGSKLFLWTKYNPNEPQTLELPEKVNVEKCLLMPYEYSGLIKASADKLSINGEEINLKANEAPFMEGETLMLPVNLVSEKLGYDVKPFNKTSMLRITKEGTKTYTIAVDSDMLESEDTSYYLRNKTMVKNNTIFVSSELFNLAENAKIVIE
ncbi:stalk domain-containing protein [uncultured Clostridium sp.]|uniref:stalk domain-containing protein n=1 Tax=uncultured Clostridium sp. TaxID=59620 RepID=UPI0028EBF89D|nr:stalk domain-containing protein [uncultured Clostridium sp.]